MRILGPLGHLKINYSMNVGLPALRSKGGNSDEPSLRPHVVQPQRVCDWIYGMLPGWLDRRLPQCLRHRRLRLGTAELIQLALQLYDPLPDYKARRSS